MELIAHRGGSFGKENSLETIIASAGMGADAIECDIRRLKDGEYVIFHDPDIKRLTGYDAEVENLTLDEMKAYMSESNHKLITFDELAKEYKEDVPILLHIKLEEYDDAFAKYVVKSGLPLIVGVQSVDMLKSFSKYLSPKQILAFLPNYDMAKTYYENGAGIIRLWQFWLDKKTPSEIKEICPGAKVYVMACNKTDEPYTDITLESMDGDVESLEKCYNMGADGVLLNDIEMALKWRKNI